MLPTRKAVQPLVSVVGLAVLLALGACSVQKDKQGEHESVNIKTPMGALNVDTNADAKDAGLAVYPGAKPRAKSEGEHDSANVNIASSMFGLKVVALEFVSEDAPEKVSDFYKKELAKYGNVLDCANGVSEHGDQLSCSDKPRERDHHELAVGTKQRQHLVSIKPDGTGTRFALVYVQTHGKEGTL